MVTDDLKAWAKNLNVEELDQLTSEERLVIIRKLHRVSLETMSEVDSLREWKHGREDKGKTHERDGDAGAVPGPDSAPQWIRADPDSPTDSRPQTPSSCVGGTDDVHPQEVVVFNSTTKELDVQRVDRLGGIRAVYSRLPSRLCKTVYVWSENINIALPKSSTSSTTRSSSSTTPRWRITEKADQRHSRDGLLYHGAIHLKRLNKSDKFRIFRGQIRWLFILKPDRDGGTNSTAG